MDAILLLTPAQKDEYYQALLGKNSQYEGVFYVGVTSTGVFCRPTCPARKPKFEHCEFFNTVQQAALGGLGVSTIRMASVADDPRWEHLFLSGSCSVDR